MAHTSEYNARPKVSPPNTVEWIKIAEDFRWTTNLPHCLGAVDGKHVRIECPPRSESQYFNYKKFNSIVLLAACDRNYTFTLVDVGAYGSQSDGGVFSNSEFGKKILNKTLNCPPDTNLPYFYIADAALPLKENIMKPFAKVTDAATEVFNKKICRARIRIEIAFGILPSKWRVLRTCISFSLENDKQVVLATVVLHNFQRFSIVNSADAEDNNDSTLNSISTHDLNTANTSTQTARNMRNILFQYLNST